MKIPYLFIIYRFRSKGLYRSVMEQDYKMANLDTDEDTNPNSNRGSQVMQVSNVVETVNRSGRSSNKLNVLVQATDVVLLVFAVIIVIAIVISFCMAGLAILRKIVIVSEGTYYCKYGLEQKHLC